MDVKYKNDYSVTTMKYTTETFTQSNKEILPEFVSWVGEDRYDDEDSLREALVEYITDYCDLVPENLPEEVEVENYSQNLELLNWEEIYPEISYLVVAPKEITCCDRAPYKANFCPTCGKPIVKE